VSKSRLEAAPTTKRGAIQKRNFLTETSITYLRRRPRRQNGLRVLADETHGSVRAQMDKDPSFVPHHSKPRAIPLASSLDDYACFFIPGDSCRCGFWTRVGLGCRVHRYYVPMEGVFYLTIYDRWGQRKLERFKSAGLKTEVLWSRPRDEKGLTGTAGSPGFLQTSPLLSA
jgi:hypothetical protein